MATTTATNAPVPAWLNLDALVPAELRAQADALRTEIERMEPSIVEFAQRAYSVVSRLDAFTQEREEEFLANVDETSKLDTEGLYTALGELTGFLHLHNAILGLANNIGAAVGETIRSGEPDWLVRIKKAEANEGNAAQ
jgi:hypothetical protein